MVSSMSMAHLKNFFLCSRVMDVVGGGHCNDIYLLVHLFRHFAEVAAFFYLWKTLKSLCGVDFVHITKDHDVFAADRRNPRLLICPFIFSIPRSIFVLCV